MTPSDAFLLAWVLGCFATAACRYCPWFISPPIVVALYFLGKYAAVGAA